MIGRFVTLINLNFGKMAINLLSMGKIF